MFSKNNVGTLIKLLSSVESYIVIVRLKFVKEENLLLLAYGVKAPEKDAEVPFSGVSIYTRTVMPTEFDHAEKTTVDLGGVSHTVSVSVSKIFNEIIGDIVSELESRAKNILTPPANTGLQLINFDMIEPFGLHKLPPKMRVTIGTGVLKYKEELNPFQAFQLGTKRLYSFFSLRMIQHATKQLIVFEGDEYIELSPKAISNSVAKFMQALSESGILDVLLEDESAVRSHIERIQKKFLGFIKKINTDIGLLKKSLIDFESNEFIIKGLELSYIIFLLIGSPKNIPINLLVWVMDDLGDDLVKDRLKELELDLFLGQERVLFEGLVEDLPDEELIKKVDLGHYTNLYETKSEGVVRDFKYAVQKAVDKYKVISEDSGSAEKKGLSKFLDKFKKNKTSGANTEDFRTFQLFPVFDSAEKELRLREFSREVSIYYLSVQMEELTADLVKKVSGEVHGVIRQMMLLHIIWISKGWAYFQSGAEDQLKDELSKKVYKLVFKWPQIKEQSIRNRWNLIRDYEVVGHNDVLEVFKRSHVKSVFQELDQLFSIKKLVVRKVGSLYQAQIGIDLEGEDSPEIIKMMKVLVEKPLRLKNPFVFKMKLMIHKMIMKSKGIFVLNGDLLRNIDFLDDILFIYNSRFGLDIPNGLLIEDVVTDLHELEEAGVVRRYVMNQQPITTVPRKNTEQLSDRKQLLLQAIGVLVERYDG